MQSTRFFSSCIVCVCVCVVTGERLEGGSILVNGSPVEVVSSPNSELFGSDPWTSSPLHKRVFFKITIIYFSTCYIILCRNKVFFNTESPIFYNYI